MNEFQKAFGILITYISLTNSDNNINKFRICYLNNFQQYNNDSVIRNNECVNLLHNFASEINFRSINTHGNCFRLYEKHGCKGVSRFSRPYSPNHNDLLVLGFKNGILSVSNCFENDICEFNKSCDASKNPMILGLNPSLPMDTIDLKGPITYQQIGENGRTESVEAKIAKNHFYTGNSINDEAHKKAKTFGRSDDIPGHIIFERFGGSGTDLRNIFPQKINYNRGIREDIEDLLSGAIEAYNTVSITVNLLYHNLNDKRPYSLIYRIIEKDTSLIFVTLNETKLFQDVKIYEILNVMNLQPLFILTNSY